MTDLADSEQLREQAKQAVDRFVRRFDDSYRLLAYHAALPLVLTPELVNYLRNEFLRGEQVPWVAEVDLLLSDLCSQVGYELYAMDTHVRAYLLEQMQQHPHFGKRRMQEVAQVLYSYVTYLSRLNPGRRQKEIEAQRWAAMVYMGDEQCRKAAREITERLIETSSGMGSARLTESGIRAELARLTSITEELSSQLEQQLGLLDYARLVQRLLRTPELVTPSELRSSYLVEDLALTFPDKLLPEELVRTLTSVSNLVGFPPIKTFEFDEGTITFEGESVINLQTFEFKIATIELKQSGWSRDKTELIVKERRQQAQYFVEELGNVQIEMVQIPGGKFIMGASEKERGSTSYERPQHEVTVPTFFMGKYPVTQAQWRAVAALPQIDRELHPNPSYFKGDKRPVEKVSWYDAVEFCSRLTVQTKRAYSLPSEAEWEYACRAGTTTPFHFGETITTDLANYNGTTNYGAGVEGSYRTETTEVGSFGVANAFGLYDMHGNVWEWCLDDWHDNYERAPTDGSAWFNENNNLSQKQGHACLRGGSWNYVSRDCRSGYRYDFVRRDVINNVVGFRVCCGVGRILQ